jgi:cytochrome c556
MKPSNAISEIWRDWDRFSGLAETLRREANQLEKDLSSQSNGSIQESSIATKQSFKKIARTCSGCHRDFRKKKK